MLASIAETYDCPYKIATKCTSEDCLAWRRTEESPTTGYCKFIGNVVRVQPEIKVNREDTIINNADAYAFGNVSLGVIVIIDFIIANVGTGFLRLTGNPTISKSGGSEFTLINMPSASIVKDGSTTFKVRFKATTTGAKAGQLSITNNDLDETPFIINLTGTGI